MGLYIQVPLPRDKTQQIVDEYAGKVISAPPAMYHQIPKNKALIIVVNNGPFEAAGFVHDEREFKAWIEPCDPRPTQYLYMDRKLACKLTDHRSINCKCGGDND